MPPIVIEPRNYKTEQITVTNGLVCLFEVNLNITLSHRTMTSEKQF